MIFFRTVGFAKPAFVEITLVYDRYFPLANRSSCELTARRRSDAKYLRKLTPPTEKRQLSPSCGQRSRNRSTDNNKKTIRTPADRCPRPALGVVHLHGSHALSQRTDVRTAASLLKHGIAGTEWPPGAIACGRGHVGSAQRLPANGGLSVIVVPRDRYERSISFSVNWEALGYGCSSRAALPYIDLLVTGRVQYSTSG